MVKKENGMNGVKVAVVAAAAAGDGKEIKRNAKSDRSVGRSVTQGIMNGQTELKLYSER